MSIKHTRKSKSIETKPTVRVKPHSYQPTKAEKEELLVIRKPNGCVPTPEEVARIALRPMNVIEDPEA